MTVIKVHQSAIFFRQRMNAREIGNHSVHRKDPIRRDQLVSRSVGIRLLQLSLQIREIIVGIAIALRFAQTHAINNRGMIERIRNHGVLRRQQGFEKPAVGIETRGVENGILRSKKLRERLFQPTM